MTKIIPLNITDATYGADPTGANDSTAAIQAALNAAAPAAGGCGLVVAPGGKYLIGGAGLIIPSAVTLAGFGRQATFLTSNGADINLVTLTGGDGGIRDLAVYTAMSGSPVNSALTIAAGTGEFEISRVQAWGGAWGINDQGGVDGVINNVFASGITGALASCGANKWTALKCDTGPMPTQQYGMCLYGNSENVQESEFDQCDFSGNFTSAGVQINDGPNTPVIAKFTACTFGAPINILSARVVMFAACEMPGASGFSLNSNVECAVVGCYSLAGQTTYPNCAKAGNPNIA